MSIATVAEVIPTSAATAGPTQQPSAMTPAATPAITSRESLNREDVLTEAKLGCRKFHLFPIVA